jgi:tetratricopeptide (TPR) repeat protein
VTEALRRVARFGDRFDRLEFTAATDHDQQDADQLLEQALGSGVVRADSGGYRFADPAVATRLSAEVAPARRPAVMTGITTRLVDFGATPAQVADLLLAGGEPAMAAPYALEAARIAAASGLHTEALRWTEAIRDHVDGQAEAALLSLRADALAAVGDHAAVPAYRKALATADLDQAPGLRTRLARAALLSGDFASAEEALAGLEANGGPDDGAILLARGMLAYFSGDIDGADAAVEAARSLALAPGAPNRLLDVITLQGMIAHNRGQWFDRLRRELRATTENPELASAVFDSHLCVAEYLLYGPTPYDEVVALTRQLRERAERTGARRGVAFAVTVAGEAALLAGDLDAARADLAEALALHVEMGADTSAAHALQRLAEVELAAGDRAAAGRLLRRALPLARWSPLARHLLQRIYGTLISAAPDADAALAVVDEAVERLDEPFACIFCQVMIAVPASIACTEGGRLDQARAWLSQAQDSAGYWQGTAWQGAVAEARAHLARAEGDQLTRLDGEGDLVQDLTPPGVLADADRVDASPDGSSGPRQRGRAGRDRGVRGMKRELRHEVLPDFRPASFGCHGHRRDTGTTILGANVKCAWSDRVDRSLSAGQPYHQPQGSAMSVGRSEERLTRETPLLRIRSV